MTDTTITTELDDTVRLILMDQPDLNGPMLRRALNTEGVTTTLREFAAVWRKYRGVQGRGAIQPTHDVNTGKPI